MKGGGLTGGDARHKIVMHTMIPMEFYNAQAKHMHVLM